MNVTHAVTRCSDVAEPWVRVPQSASAGTTATYLSKTPQQSTLGVPRGKAQIQFLENQLTKHRISRWKGSLSRMMQHQGG